MPTVRAPNKALVLLRLRLWIALSAGKEGGGVLKSLGGGGRTSAPVATGVSAAEEAKKHVRAALAAAKAEKRSIRRQDNVKQETSEIAKMQSIKAEFNTTRFKRLAKVRVVYSCCFPMQEGSPDPSALTMAAPRSLCVTCPLSTPPDGDRTNGVRRRQSRSGGAKCRSEQILSCARGCFTAFLHRAWRLVSRYG
jgi:hypothetical protein